LILLPTPAGLPPHENHSTKITQPSYIARRRVKDNFRNYPTIEAWLAALPQGDAAV
jgi:hypothetical protein